MNGTLTLREGFVASRELQNGISNLTTCRHQETGRKSFSSCQTEILFELWLPVWHVDTLHSTSTSWITSSISTTLTTLRGEELVFWVLYPIQHLSTITHGFRMVKPDTLITGNLLLSCRRFIQYNIWSMTQSVYTKVLIPRRIGR